MFGYMCTAMPSFLHGCRRLEFWVVSILTHSTPSPQLPSLTSSPCTIAMGTSRVATGLWQEGSFRGRKSAADYIGTSSRLSDQLRLGASALFFCLSPSPSPFLSSSSPFSEKVFLDIAILTFYAFQALSPFLSENFNSCALVAAHGRCLASAEPWFLRVTVRKIASSFCIRRCVHCTDSSAHGLPSTSHTLLKLLLKF